MDRNLGKLRKCLQIRLMQEAILHFLSALQHSPPALAGLFSGIVGSFVADWSNWGFESRRDRREARRKLLEQARSVLTEPPPKEDFRESSLYFQLSPYLLASTRAQMTKTLLPLNPRITGFPIEVPVETCETPGIVAKPSIKVEVPFCCNDFID